MTIWLAALYSFGILGASAILFALGAWLIIWAVESNHMEVFLAAALIVCWIVLAICIYVEGGAV
nr:MAG TPA: Cytochrome oxidase maturation protein cbb3-type [Caudoviricetes sp.]